MFSQRLVDSKIQKSSRYFDKTVIFCWCECAAGAKRRRRQAPEAPSAAGAKRRRRQAPQAPSAAGAKRCRRQAPQAPSAAGAKRRRRQAPLALSAAGAASAADNKRRRRLAPQACCNMAHNRKLVAQAQRGSRALTRRGVCMCSITRRGKATVKCVCVYVCIYVYYRVKLCKSCPHKFSR